MDTYRDGKVYDMRVDSRDDTVAISMTRKEADDLLREIDKWPELPKVERDLVDALKAFRDPSSGRAKA